MSEARSENLLAHLNETHVLAWSEDAATTRLPDHEDPRAAMKRLGRRWEELEEAKAAGCHEGFDILGDCEAYELKDGAVVVLSYPGASEIWTLKCAVVSIRLELRLEIDGVGSSSFRPGDPLDEIIVRRFLSNYLQLVGVPDDAVLDWNEL